MIPDIAFMVVVYGAARLITAVLDPYRRGNGKAATIATGASWLVAALAIVALGLLGVAVLLSSGSLSSDLTK